MHHDYRVGGSGIGIFIAEVWEMERAKGEAAL